MSTQEIQQTLQDSSNPEFEPVSLEDSGPLSQPVVEKADPADLSSNSGQNQEKEPLQSPIWADEKTDQDAPVQDIDPFDQSSSKDPQSPLSSAGSRQAAEAVLAVVDNLLEIGAGYLVRIPKREEFYELPQIGELIDEQNLRNTDMIKLAREDKILLSPLLSQVIGKRAGYLTPEQQLLGAAVSILFKKGQLIAQIKAENNVLVERITAIIREERPATNAQPPQPEPSKDKAA